MPQLTVKAYEEALDAFTNTISGLDENGRSVLLYGSMARKEIIPGHSDLDFWVFLQQDAFADRDRFSQAFGTMVAAGKQLLHSGLPVIHAFCYYNEDELDWLPKALVPNLQNEKSSRIIWGDDVRAQMSSTPASREFYRTAYFQEMRRQVFLPMIPFIFQDELNEKLCQMIVGGLKYVKYIPEAACAAFDEWPGEIAAVSRLGELLPHLDMELVRRVELFRTGTAPTAVSTTVQQFLKESLEFVEAVHESLLDHWEQNNK
ncbi:MAG: nucleotidyltransferase domain-containing protein [Chloroflexi bacterium]|nr:nucleotidyltransferase domain-containing protein [Chloroflexota bacterium]